jgi:hypothetical protein
MNSMTTTTPGLVRFVVLREAATAAAIFAVMIVAICL